MFEHPQIEVLEKNSLEARVKVLKKEIEAFKKQNEAMASCES